MTKHSGKAVNLEDRFSNPSKKSIVAFIVIVKLLIFVGLLLKENSHYIEGFWGISYYSDEMSYLDPIDNLITKGEYQPDVRMPGLGIIYLPFRLFFDRGVSCNLVMLIQMIVDIISTYLLGLIALKIFKSNKSFILTVLLYSISISVSFYAIWMMTESFTISFSIISVYFFLRYLETRKLLLLLFSGVFVTWAIFMRPIVGALWLVLLLYLFIDFYKTKIKSINKLIASLLFFCSSFILLDSIWIIRNYITHKEFIPLMKTSWIDISDVTASNYRAFVFTFVNSFGGDYVMWEPSAEVRWMGITEKPILLSDTIHRLPTTIKDLPGYIYTSRFNRDSLILVRDKVIQLEANTVDDETRIQYCYYINSKLKEYRASIIREKPFIYYVFGPLRVAKKLIINHGTSDLFLSTFKDLSLFQKFIRIQMAVIYMSIIFGGLLGLALLLLKGELFTYAFIPIVYSVLYILAITFIFRNSETRYLLPVYPFLTLMFIYLVKEMRESLRKHRIF